ncbi:MAG: NfeD family protein [Okeania sp. SIO3C4]|nr:NfeD family protein [Okeania sp. SIO3C4]
MWLIIGIVLSSIEFLLPQKIQRKFKLIPIILGCSAILEALILCGGSSLFKFDWRMVMYDEFEWQIFYWMGLSLAGVIWVRPTFTHRKNNFSIPQALEVKTLTEILPGETGRVIYEGNSWQACCQDKELKIGAKQKVFILRREGNTLIIVPESFFDS